MVCPKETSLRWLSHFILLQSEKGRKTQANNKGPFTVIPKVDMISLGHVLCCDINFRYLVHLETPGDPAWECLVHMQKWLLNLLNDCKEHHILKGNTWWIKIHLACPLIHIFINSNNFSILGTIRKNVSYHGAQV